MMRIAFFTFISLFFALALSACSAKQTSFSGSSASGQYRMQSDLLRW